MRRFFYGFECDYAGPDALIVQPGSWTAAGADEPPRSVAAAVRVEYPRDCLDPPAEGWWRLYLRADGTIRLSRSARYTSLTGGGMPQRKLPIALWRTPTGWLPWQQHGPDTFWTAYNDAAYNNAAPSYVLSLDHLGAAAVTLPLMPEESRLAHLHAVVDCMRGAVLKTPGVSAGILLENGSHFLSLITNSTQQLTLSRFDGILRVGVRGWRWREPL